MKKLFANVDGVTSRQRGLRRAAAQVGAMPN
jgi:hypothetical protein